MIIVKDEMATDANNVYSSAAIQESSGSSVSSRRVNI